METTIQGYTFDGDPDGLKFVQSMNYDEIMTIVYCVNNRGRASILDNYKKHLEITKSGEGIYLVNRI